MVHRPWTFLTYLLCSLRTFLITSLDPLSLSQEQKCPVHIISPSKSDLALHLGNICCIGAWRSSENQHSHDMIEIQVGNGEKKGRGDRGLLSSTLFKMNVDSWALDRRDLMGQAKAGETAQHTVWALQTPESSLIVKITTYKNLCLLNTTCLKALRFQITLNICVCWERTSFAGSLGQRVCADLGKPAGSKAGLGDSPACLHTPCHTTPQVWDIPQCCSGGAHLVWPPALLVLASCTVATIA